MSQLSSPSTPPPAASAAGLVPQAQAAARSDRRREIVTTPANDVEPETVEWLWPGRFAIGTLGLVLGDPDNGKSLLTLDMAARVSRGRAWPDGAPCPAGQVLLVTCEDSAAQTIRPRLEAAGADLERVHIFCGAKAYRTGGDGGAAEAELGTFNFSLRQDPHPLEAWLARTGGVRLVVLDPLGAYSDGANTHNDGDTRALLAPFATLAERARASIVGIVHTNKSPGGKALYRASGSLAFIAAARHVYALGRVRCDPTRRLLARVKNNLSGDESGMAFAIEPSRAGPPVLIWEPDPLAIDAQGVLDGTEAKLGKLAEAEAWLGSLLTRGPKKVTEIRSDASADYFSWRTIERAKQNLGVLTQRYDLSHGRTAWCWVMPERG